MGKTSALIFVGAIALAAAGRSALAADLPSLPPPPPPPPVSEDFSGFYIRGDVGVGSNDFKLRQSYGDPNYNPAAANNDVQQNQKSIGDSAFVGAGIGYQINNWFRVDATGEYRTAVDYRATASYRNVDYTGNGQGQCGTAAYAYNNDGSVSPTGASGAVARCYDQYHGTVQSTVALVNGYIDLGTWYRLTPYVGGGVGGAYHRLSGLTDMGNNGGFGYASSNDKWNFAWAVMAGVDYSVNRNLKLELGYRYLDMGSIKSSQIICSQSVGCPFEAHKLDLTSNDVHVGMRWLFDPIVADAAPMVWEPAPTISRRY